MPDRATLLEAFLERSGWGGAPRRPLAGDASRRRYLRLAGRDGAAILMDADPATGENVAPFLRVRAHLAASGLSVPEPIAADPERGFVLMEDFGDGLFMSILEADPAAEPRLYAAATDALVHLQRRDPPGWARRYDADAMSAALRPARDWYLGPGATTDADWAAFEAAFAAHLGADEQTPPVLLHRDYHVQNLVWLPGREGIARVGMLDFQDALSGHPAYDLASLLQDARRDVPPEIEREMIARFVARSGHAPDAFGRAYALQGAQRHVRILGIFARLAATEGKAAYLDLMPRVRASLLRNLDHPALGALKARALDLFARPDARSGARSA